MNSFCLVYHGNENWSVKNEQGDWWCGKNEWVHETSSYWGIDPDCVNEVFNYEELERVC